MKKLLIMITIISIVMSMFSMTTFALENKIDIYINGQLLVIPAGYGAPFNSDGRTFVPVRIISSALGCEVGFDQATQTITINGDIKMKIGSDKIETPNGIVEMDVPVFSNPKENRSYVPIRFVSQVLGYKVDWDMKGGHLNVYITEGNTDNVNTSEDNNSDNGNNGLLINYENMSLKDNKYLVDFMSQYNNDLYFIKDTNMTFDPKGVIGGNAAVQVYNQMGLHVSNWYEVKIMFWNEDCQKVTKAVLTSIAGEDAGVYAFDYFVKARTEDIKTDEWISYKDIKFLIDTQSNYIGNSILIAPLK